MKEIYALSPAELFEVAEMMSAGVKEEFNNALIIETFGTWQIVETVKAAVGGKNNKATSFQDYARILGLFDQETEEERKIKALMRQMDKEEALRTAREIRELDRGASNQ